MRIIIDGRPMTEKNRCGIGAYTLEISKRLVENHRHGFSIWTSGRAAAWPKEIRSNKGNFDLKHTKLPNKLVNILLRTGKKQIENFAGKGRVVYLPNQTFFSSRLPFVLTVHDLSFLRYPEFFTLKGRLWHRTINFRDLAKRAKKLIAVSEHTKTDLIELLVIPPEKISVATPAVGPEYQPAVQEKIDLTRKKYSLTEKYFLYVGAIEPRKNVLGLIEAFNQVQGEAHLVLIGGRGWKNSDVYRAANRSPKREMIHFFGYVSPAEKIALYSDAVALVYPSFYEGFGMPIIEAMACGAPVITSQVSSLPEVVGDAGILVNPHDIHTIAAAMNGLQEDQAARKIFRERGLARAKKFTWEKSAKTILEAIVETRK